MTCIWNGNLHRWKAVRSNKHSQKQFLNLDHWIGVPKIQGMWWTHMVCYTQEAKDFHLWRRAHCHLVFTSSDDESPEKPSEWHSPHSSADARSTTPREADVSSSVHHNLCPHIMPTRDQFLTEAWDDNDDDTTLFYEHFPTAPFNDDIRTEEKFQIDACASMRDLMIWITSVPTLVCMIAPPSAQTYCNPLCKMKQCLTMNRWTSVQLIGTSRYHDDDKWCWHSWSWWCFRCSMVCINILIDPTYKWKGKIVYSAPCTI